jgi:hypothetical protein
MSTGNVDQIPADTKAINGKAADTKVLRNDAAKNVPYFTPIQDPQAGTAWDEQPPNTLFAPLKLRGLTLNNRIIVSPMCQCVVASPPPLSGFV